MLLTDAFFHGHDHIVENARGLLTPYRFSAERIAFYSAENEVFSPRAQNSSGISIEFETCADSFTLDLCLTNEVRNENSLTIYEDGHLAQIVGITWDEPKTKLIYRKKNTLKAGKACQYAIYLPTMATASVQNLSAEDAKPLPKREKQLLALGDSITQGVYAQASAHAYPTRLARQFGMELCNQGVGGYHFRADAFEQEADPSVITLSYGINDISVHTGEENAAQVILANAEACFAKLAAVYPGVPMVCLTPIWRADFAPAQLPIYDAVTKGLLALCEKYGVYGIDGSVRFPHDDTLFTDGYLHPTDDGFAVMAEIFADGIKAVL